MSRKTLRQPTAWRLMLLAFAVWAAVFIIGYTAALLAPDHPAVDLLLIVLTVLAVPLLVWIDHCSNGLSERALVRASVVVAGAAILFNGLAALG